MSQIDDFISETADSLLDMTEANGDERNWLRESFADIVGNAIEKWGLHVMRQELERCNRVLSVFEANVKHLDVAPHWTTGKCGDRWLVYYDNLAVTLGEYEQPVYRSFGYASEAVEWILGPEGQQYPQPKEVAT